MVTHQTLITALFIMTLGLACGTHFTASFVIKGSVSCMDCVSHHDISGIMVSVKCDEGKKLATVAFTKEDGSFETTLTSNPPVSAASCRAKILGGAQQLYVHKTTSESKIIKSLGPSPYTTSEPLRFYTECPNKKCGAPGDLVFGSSKTIDLPKEWGLAPTSYYMPFIPIIGIP
ncbi:unnamed protein product [Cuscuta epithymum]|uniref:Pollen Ole e 1 allergen and extensin family protein n=1 Tax=Cuscuta epithymum TaxID=186058 RepID=A0AAV0D6D5_9ASTE|nr:unnamed protein product [Cuscuta epithymum]CAH9148101.1 unnamed protein product [Cuscuta epithymum]